MNKIFNYLQQRQTQIIPLAAICFCAAAVIFALIQLQAQRTLAAQTVLHQTAIHARQALEWQINLIKNQTSQININKENFSQNIKELINQYPAIKEAIYFDKDNYEYSINNQNFIHQNELTKIINSKKFDTEKTFYLPPFMEEKKSYLPLYIPTKKHKEYTIIYISLNELLNTNYALSSESTQYSLIDNHNTPLTNPALTSHASFITDIELKIKDQPFINPLILRAKSNPELTHLPWVLPSNPLFWLIVLLAAITAALWIANAKQWQQRQKAQIALQEETNFRRAMENSMVTGMRVLDLEGKIIYVNPAFCQMTGWSETELIGQTSPFSYWPEEDSKRLSDLLKAELDNQIDAKGVQIRVKRKDGQTLDARIYVSPLIDGQGKQTGLMASLVDITEPNRIRKQLSNSHQRFTAVLQALDACVSVAPIGSTELLFANKLYRQWFGETTDGHLKMLVRGGTIQTSEKKQDDTNKLFTTKFDKTENEKDHHDNVDALAGLPTTNWGNSELEPQSDPALEIKTSAAMQNAPIHIERLGKWLEVRTRYLTWVDGRLAQMIIATDVTERHHAQQLAAVQAEKMQATSRLITMGEMASSVAHELNQPLAAISNYCTGIISRLQKNSITQEELMNALTKTANQAQRAGQVIHHIKSFVKKSQPRRQWVSPYDIIEQSLEIAEIELSRRKVKLNTQIQNELPQLHADPILISQVLINLIKNAAEAIDNANSPAHRRKITLQVEQKDQTIHFQIQDTGPGLNENMQARIFEAFFSTKNEGMGIGLNLCRSIIEAHQGKITAENTKNEQNQTTGCTFSFWLPISVHQQN